MLHNLFELEHRSPAWLRPTFRGALLVVGLGVSETGRLLALVFLGTLTVIVGVVPAASLFLTLFLLTTLAAAAAGTIQGLLEPLEDGGRSGVWLRWFLSGFGFMVILIAITPGAPLAALEPLAGLLATIFGVTVATAALLADPRQSGRPTPERFRRLQNRERLWAAEDRALARLHAGLASGGRTPRERIRPV